MATCVPADPDSKGGSEATVRIAEADLAPTEANPRDGYTSCAELVCACEAWMAEVNCREHRVTRRAPTEMLAEEQQRLHRPLDGSLGIGCYQPYLQAVENALRVGPLMNGGHEVV